MEFTINQCVEYKNPRLTKKMYCWVTAINKSETGDIISLNLTNMDTGYNIMNVPLKFVAEVNDNPNENDI